MKPVNTFFANIRMTTAITALMVLSILLSIGIVSAAVYANLRSQSEAAAAEQQRVNLGIAATILERRISGSVVTWLADGRIESFHSFAIPPFFDSAIVDSITRVTGQEAAVFVFEPDTSALLAKTISLVGSAGERLTDSVLASGAPYRTIAAGGTFAGEVAIDERRFLGALQPIATAEGQVLGAIFVGTPVEVVAASANGALQLIATVSSVVMVVLVACGLVFSRLIARPAPRLARVMEAIAAGDYATEVPYARRRSEVGAMARAVEVFRQNGLRISSLTEAEADRILAQEQERQQMMSALQGAFGTVVNAAVAGDFSGQVTVEFPDPELNALAGGVNNLVSTFNRGVTEIGQVLGAMADADLTLRMEGDYEGAFATLKSDINAVADKLTEVVGQLRHSSGSLKTATSEILSGANDLSERTTKQAATIEETSAAMEQLAATVMKNAQRARDASAGAMQVTRTAEEGGQVMDAATSAMERITQSSAKISNIIGMIDDIAFQTNLLALNASVEAARAGDAGKGFTVVAVEVRRLAQSAAQASSEVKVLIEQSAGEVNSGSKLVGEAAGKLRAMLDAARGNNGLLVSIANDSREQASAIEEVTTAVRIMDEMTQHNAALVEETNAAIEQTEAQATELDRIVEIFVLDGNLSPKTGEGPEKQQTAGRSRLGGPPRRRVLSARGNTATQPAWNEF
jgi:methyl-accepting chemotaxis protein